MLISYDSETIFVYICLWYDKITVFFLIVGAHLIKEWMAKYAPSIRRRLQLEGGYNYNIKISSSYDGPETLVADLAILYPHFFI